MIYLSTGGFKNQPAWKTCEIYKSLGITNIELSGGIFDDDQLNQLKKLKKFLKFQIHNYFPPPKIPFVLNLASRSSDIYKRSLNQIETALKYCNELNCDKYSFHAGFLFDPKISELGKKINYKRITDKQSTMEIFLDRLFYLSKKAEDYGVSLMIENNVLSNENFLNYNSINPLLMVDEEDCKHVMENTPKNINLLIDVGHLKVSSKTLKFQPEIFLNSCSQWIKGYHLSDNSGLTDDNNFFDKNSWFWPFINKELSYYTVEVYESSIIKLTNQVNFASKILDHNV